MNILIDTNIVLPLEPGSYVDIGINTENAILFHNLSNRSGNILCVHTAIEHDLDRDNNKKRSAIRRKLIKRYKSVPTPPDVSILDQSIVGSPVFGSNDYVDNCYLAAVKADAVDFLVSEDRGVHRKARRLGIESRVLLLQDAINLLRDFFDESPSPPPAVQKVYVHELNDQDEIFNSLRADYHPEFNEWLKRCKREHREAYIITDQFRPGLAGVLIFKQEADLPTGETGKTLKLCTLKVSGDHGGNRYGELLLKTAFDYADSNKYKHIYFTTFSKHEGLIAFAESFGFKVSNTKNRRGENIVCKSLSFSADDIETLSPLEAHVRFGPRKAFFYLNSTFIIPIKPHFHQILFPELEHQLFLFHSPRPCGNSIKKAYLCHSKTKQLNPGDNILFYRSHDISGITAIGVIEETRRSSDPDVVARYVGTRTVYKYREIVDLCQKPTLAIKFRFVKGLQPISLGELETNGVLKGAPQSISKLSQKGAKWIQEKIRM